MTDLDMIAGEAETTQPKQSGLSAGSLVLLLGILVVVAVFGIALARQNQTQPTSVPAPEFTVTTFEGEEFRLSDLRGQVVILNFWASWCLPCRDEAPALQSIWEEYRDRGVVVIGVAYTDTETGARAFIEEFQQDYPNGMDFGTRISDAYHIQGVPETFIIDQNGNVAEFIFAQVTETGMAATINRLLNSET